MMINDSAYGWLGAFTKVRTDGMGHTEGNIVQPAPTVEAEVSHVVMLIFYTCKILELVMCSRSPCVKQVIDSRAVLDFLFYGESVTES